MSKRSKPKFKLFKPGRFVTLTIVLLATILTIPYVVQEYKQTALPANIKLLSNNFSDSQSELLISQGKEIFSVKLDNSRPETIFTSNYNIVRVQNYTNFEDPIISTVESHPNDRLSVIGKMWRLIDGRYLQELKDEIHNHLENATQLAQYYREFTKEELPSGYIPHPKPTILKDELNGAGPQEIGTLSTKYNDLSFYPSFDGSYLLNNYGGRGGGPAYPIPAYVYSTKTQKVIPIKIKDFDWYGNNAIWIDNNKLLTDRNALLTFENDKYAVEHIDLEIFDRTQNDLSPSREFLISDSRKEILITKLENGISKSISKPKNENIFIQKIGWNKSSTKYAYAINDNKENVLNVYIYYIPSGQSTQVLSIKTPEVDLIKEDPIWTSVVFR